MRLLKSQSLLSLVNSYVVDSPQPANLSYMWNFGSLLALCLGIQIVTGVLLAMHYTPNVDLAFISVEHESHFPALCSLNFAICWNTLRTFGTRGAKHSAVTIQKIGQSAGNQTA